MKFTPLEWEQLILAIVLAMALIALAVSVLLLAALWIQTGRSL
jgi:hypothetical protein